MAKRFSQPQGFLTISDKLAQSELFFERRQQLIDLLLRGALAVDADQGFGTGEANQDPAAVLEVVLEAVVRPRAHHATTGNLGGRILLQPAVQFGAPGS